MHKLKKQHRLLNFVTFVIGELEAEKRNTLQIRVIVKMKLVLDNF